MRLEKELDSFSSFYWSKLFSSHLMFLIMQKWLMHTLCA